MKYLVKYRKTRLTPFVHGCAAAIAGVLLLVAVAPAPAQTPRIDARKLDSIAAVPVTAGRAVGLVAAVVKGNDTLLMKAFGKADVEWDVPMQTDAMFEVGSLAKQFAAASILQLRDAGKLSLDDPIAKWVPSVGATGNTITLRRLLTHTSGIFGFADAPDFEVNFMGVARFPRDSAYRLIKIDPLAFPPGEAQAYSNSGFWLLGAVVEKVSGMKYEDYLQKQIFDPLGMKRTMYCNGSVNVPHRAHGYMVMPRVIRRAPMVDYAWVFAPGALCSTAGDLVTWLQALHGAKVLTPKSYAEMTTQARLNDGTPLQYGMGIKVGEDYRGLKYIGHGGTAPGFTSEATWYPDAKMAVVVLTNSARTPSIVGALAREILPAPRATLPYYTDDPAPFVGKYRYTIGANQDRASGFTIDVLPSPTGLAFSMNGSPPEALPWAGGMTFYVGDNVTLAFHRANSDRGPVMELRRDAAGNLAIFRKQ